MRDPLGDEPLQSLELQETDGPLQVHHPVVVAESDVVVLSCVPVVTQQAQTRGQSIIIGGDHAPLACGHVLGGIEGEATCAERAHLLSIELCTMSLGAVFHQGDIAILTDLRYRFEVEGLAVEVNADNRSCPGSYLLQQVIGIDIECPGIHICKDWFRSPGTGCSWQLR